MSDLWNGIKLNPLMDQLCTTWARFRMKKAIEDAEPMVAEFIKQANRFADIVHPAGISQCHDPVFEGAQGLLLDQNNKEFFPHLTRSNTGMRNVNALAEMAGFTDLDIYYVTRTYLTRHGAGPLPGEDASMHFEDKTNGQNEWQGALRFAPLKWDPLQLRCFKDCEGKHDYKIVMTHCDQLDPPFRGAQLYVHGPTRTHVADE